MEIRKAREGDLKTIYLMGFDVWSGGLSESQYIQTCFESKKYKSGTWYVLTNGDELLSSLILYESTFNLPQGFCGIGSIATSRPHRNKGYASHLIENMCGKLKLLGLKGVYLYSDIHPEFYRKHGFLQGYTTNLHCMVRLFYEQCVPEKIPDYF